MAAEARLWAEDMAKRNGFQSDLMMMCGITSRKLYRLLKQAGVPSVIVSCKSGGHMFGMWNGHVVDVTATQFNVISCERIKPIEIRTPDMIHDSQYWWEVGPVFYSDRDARRWQIEEDWPKFQVDLRGQEDV